MKWHEMNWPEIGAADKETPVLVPLGSCEQHGHHLPVFVDSLQVDAIAEQVEANIPGSVLLLPTLWLGSSHHHRDFPGTVSVLPSLYSEVIKAVAASIRAAGFRRIVFFNGHGGNKVPAAQALSEWVCENDAADDAYLILATWWELCGPDVTKGMDSSGISHACEYETSFLLALRPDLVHLDRACEAPMALDTEWFRSEGTGPHRLAVFRRFHRLTAAGSMGRPSAATADKGQRILEHATAAATALMRDIATWPELPKRGPR